jgi:hypothetical protein
MIPYGLNANKLRLLRQDMMKLATTIKVHNMASSIAVKSMNKLRSCSEIIPSEFHKILYTAGEEFCFHKILLRMCLQTEIQPPTAIVIE